MKRLTKALLILLLIFAIISMSSCEALGGLLGSDGADGEGSEKDKTLYALGVRIDELNNTCLFIPGIGEVSMPTTADGESVSFTVGDVVRIKFNRPVDEISIMECYPARFPSDVVSEIDVKEGDYEIKVGDGKILFSDKIEGFIDDVSVGDDVTFGIVKSAEQSGALSVTIINPYCDGKVTELSDARYTLALECEDAEDLLSILFENTIKISSKKPSQNHEKK